MNPDWLIPDWPAPPHVKAVFTSRGIAQTGFASKSGVSQPPFDALNLGDHVGDDPNHVMANRHMLQVLLGVKPIYLKQVHGTEVVTLTSKAPQTPHGTVADACITTEKKLACTIMVADCLPVFFTDVEGRFVAAAHAGWRGLADGVLRQNIESIHAIAGVNIAYSAIKIIAWLGPCIGPAAFEVGAEVKAEFAAKLVGSAPFFTQTGSPESGKSDKWLADLAGLARLQLKQLGLADDQIFGNDSSAGWCTVNNPLRFFSHRRDAVKLGSSGRMAGCIWLE
ncbi:MAG: peptidoglycan editing factor PgeF [Burkholderiaceae bacterium]